MTSTLTGPEMKPRFLPHPVPETSELVQRIRDLVRQNARRWKLLVGLEALGLAVSVPLAYLLLLFLLDNQVHLPVWGRFVANLGFLAGAIFLATRLVKRWRLLRLTEDQVALAIERRTPGGVQNRLINAVQIARDAGAAPELSRAVVEENYTRLQQIALERAAQTRPALVRLGVAGLLIAAGISFWALQPARFTNAATRILLPFADVDPLYRTTLMVEPGDVEATGDVTIRVRIRGDRPETLTVLSTGGGKRNIEVLPVASDADEVTYTFRDVQQTMTYQVKGGDFTSPLYRIEVPTPAVLTLLRATFAYPAYTGLAEKSIEKASGELEALQGTTARLTFQFDQPADEASLLVERVPVPKPPAPRDYAVCLLPAAFMVRMSEPPPAPEPTTQRLSLQRVSLTEFAGTLLFENVVSYRIETRQTNREPSRSAPFALRIQVDQDPRLELSGLDRQAEVQVDSRLVLKARATDDYGLEKVGLFVRRGTDEANERDDWQPVAIWPAGRKTSFQQDHPLSVSALQAGEGEKLEVALRGVDTDPLKKGRWTTGPVHTLLVGGEGVVLQLQYEQIVRTEAELKALLESQKRVRALTADWLRKLDGAEGLRWDDPKTVDALHAAAKEQAGEQQKVRQASSKTARTMVAQAGDLRISVGMLADTEMVRAGQALETVTTRDTPETKRAAFADARGAQERTIRSLQEIIEAYAGFRASWELANMIPFTKMLAERQKKLAEQSRQQTGSAAEVQVSASRRQAKVLELCQLIQPAFTGLGQRLEETDVILARAFKAGATTFASDSLKAPMLSAIEDLKAGRWADAATKQAVAAKELADLHERLRQAQSEAARQALVALREKARHDAEAQKEIDKLKLGNTESGVREDPSKVKIEDIIRMGQVANPKKRPPGDDKQPEKGEGFDDIDRSKLELMKDSGVRQDPNILKLGNTPEKSAPIPSSTDKEYNKVKAFIQDKFADLVGKLLEEADELDKNFQTITLSTNQNNNDPGDIGKQGGRINSTGAVAATGNKKPPTSNHGGVSRTGLSGARAYGKVVGDEGVNRRGRDQAQEGQQRVADQEGTIKEKSSDDMYKDTSTGFGGKKVQSEHTTFSIKDAGKWTNDILKYLDKPQKKYSMVERAGDKIDPRIAALLRDTDSKQEQLIERIKAVRKELKNLYLPTDHLDEALAALNANMERLKDRPDADLFRMQAQTLDRLRSAMKVFRNAGSGFQPSLPRERVIRGRVLDEPARPALPGYEDAVKRYYEKLAQ